MVELRERERKRERDFLSSAEGAAVAGKGEEYVRESKALMSAAIKVSCPRE